MWCNLPVQTGVAKSNEISPYTMPYIDLRDIDVAVNSEPLPDGAGDETEPHCVQTDDARRLSCVQPKLPDDAITPTLDPQPVASDAAPECPYFTLPQLVAITDYSMVERVDQCPGSIAENTSCCKASAAADDIDAGDTASDCGKISLSHVHQTPQFNEYVTLPNLISSTADVERTS